MDNKRIENWYGDRKTGKIPKGCKLCALGGKVVLFITGECLYKCFYCPISIERRGNQIFANEQKIKSPQEAIEEAKKIDALGVGITGGEPTLKTEEVKRYMSEFKDQFGRDFHIHLYTARAIPEEELDELAISGLDEIRFHFPQLKITSEIKNSINAARKYSWDVGIEVPAIPGKKDELIEIILFAIKNKLKFVNLNELEFTETNYKKLEDLNFRTVKGSIAAVKGSRELALKMLKQFKKSPISLHYCSSQFKDRVQLRNRFLRRAKNFAKPYDEITEEGLVIRGRIKTKDSLILKEIQETILKVYKIKKKLVEIDTKKNELYSHSEIIRETFTEVIERYQKDIIQISIIHQYPMKNGFIAYLDPLYEK